MARVADVNTEFGLGRAGLESIAAGAGNGALYIIGMDIFFHGMVSFLVPWFPTKAKISLAIVAHYFFCEE